METLETRLHAVEDFESLKRMVDNVTKLYGPDSIQAWRAERVLLLRAERDLRARRAHS